MRRVFEEIQWIELQFVGLLFFARTISCRNQRHEDFSGFCASPDCTFVRINQFQLFVGKSVGVTEIGIAVLPWAAVRALMYAIVFFIGRTEF